MFWGNELLDFTNVEGRKTIDIDRCRYKVRNI